MSIRLLCKSLAVFWCIALWATPGALASEQCRLFFLECLQIQGALSQDHVNELNSRATEIDFVILESPGGPVGYGMEIGDVLRQHKIPVLVKGVCASSCVEFIIPSAEYVVAVNSPKFAVHTNPLIIRDIALARGIPYRTNCLFAKPALWLEQLYEEKGLKASFVQDQLDETGPPIVDFIEGPDGCLRIDLTTFEHPMPWVVSASVLKQRWGIDIREVDF